MVERSVIKSAQQREFFLRRKEFFKAGFPVSQKPIIPSWTHYKYTWGVQNPWHSNCWPVARTLFEARTSREFRMGAHSGRFNRGVRSRQVEQSTTFLRNFARRSNAEVWDVEQQRWNPEHESVKQLPTSRASGGHSLARDECAEPCP